MARVRRNKFKKGSKSRKARSQSKKFWRSKKGRLIRRRIKRYGLKKAMKMSKGPGRKRRRARSVPVSRKRTRTTKRRRKSTRHMRAGRIGAATRKARRLGYLAAGEKWKNPRRRRSRKGRRRSSSRRRRNLYVVANPRRRRSRKGRRTYRRRRNTYLGIFTNRRRRNPGRMLATIKPALYAIGGFAAVRTIPALVARFAPGVVASIAGAAGTWGDVALSAGALALMTYVGGRIPVVGNFLGNSDVLFGATISVVLDIALRVVPPNILAMIGLVPAAPTALAGWSPGERSGSIGGYVQTPVLGGYVATPMLGAYVEQGGMGLDVRQALMGLGAEVTSGPCPGCPQLPAVMSRLPLGARMRAQGFFGTAGRSIPAEPGVPLSVPGIFRGSIFGG